MVLASTFRAFLGEVYVRWKVCELFAELICTAFGARSRCTVEHNNHIDLAGMVGLFVKFLMVPNWIVSILIEVARIHITPLLISNATWLLTIFLIIFERTRRVDLTGCFV